MNNVRDKKRANKSLPFFFRTEFKVFFSIIYYLSFKKPWKKEKKLPKPFFLTILSFIIFIIISKTLDFFLAISVLSIFVSYYWGERRIFYLLLVSIIFPLVVFIFFEMILGLRFPPGIITNLYYY